MLHFGKHRGTLLRLMLAIGIVIIPLFSEPSKVFAQDLFILNGAQTGQTVKPRLAAPVTSIPQAANSNSRIVELALLAPTATLLPTTVVHITNTSNGAGGWNPSSPDPSGIDYWPLTGTLLVSDSEVDEISAYWMDTNVYRATPSGMLISTCRTTTFSSEPSGVAINPNNNHIFFSDDNGVSADRVFELGLGTDGTYCTADDTVTSTPVGTLYGATDAEDVAYGNNTLFIADGVNAEIYVVPLGANGVLGGGDDGSVTHFDTAVLNFNNVEGIGYNGDSGTLFIASALPNERFLGEVTTSGVLLNIYDLASAGLIHPEDVTYAPGSLNPAVKNIYLTDRGNDNNVFPNENDGRIFEINLGIPRVVSALRASTNPTGAASVDFTVTFSESVTGVDVSDFSLTTDITGAAVSGVSSSGTTYTVTVNTGTDNGTIRLDVIDDDSITDSAGLKLGGVGAGNGIFTTGDVYTVTKPVAGNWDIRGVGSFLHGTSTDIPVPADYNGDGRDDLAIFRESNSTWYVYGVGPFQYGTTNDIPVIADYDGDGKDDVAVFRESNSTWYVYGVGPFQYGTTNDIPVVADYNGDGKDDIAVFRPSNSTWYIYGVGSFLYGTVNDIPVVGDYNGDGKADIAVFRPSNSTWYIRGVGPFAYGTVNDIPVVADYNGDSKDDIAVFRPSNSTWYIRGVGSFAYGISGDIPVVGDYNGDGKDDIAVFRP